VDNVLALYMFAVIDGEAATIETQDQEC